MVRGRPYECFGCLPRCACRRRQGREDRHGVGGRAGGRTPHLHLPRTTRGGLPVCGRPAEARDQARRRRLDLHADDARTRDRHARLRPDWRRALRDLRWLLQRGDRRPQRRRQGRGRDHRRRRLAAGLATAPQKERRRGAQEIANSEARDRAQADRPAGRHGAGPRCLVARPRGWHAHRHAPRGDGFGVATLHPLYQWLDRKAEGHQAHDRRLPALGEDHGRVGL